MEIEAGFQRGKAIHELNAIDWIAKCRLIKVNYISLATTIRRPCFFVLTIVSLLSFDFSFLLAAIGSYQGLVRE